MISSIKEAVIKHRADKKAGTTRGSRSLPPNSDLVSHTSILDHAGRASTHRQSLTSQLHTTAWAYIWLWAVSTAIIPLGDRWCVYHTAVSLFGTLSRGRNEHDLPNRTPSTCVTQPPRADQDVLWLHILSIFRLSLRLHRPFPLMFVERYPQHMSPVSCWVLGDAGLLSSTAWQQ